jgi:hypothetical protein
MDIGNVPGLLNLVPKPLPLHGYALINGEASLATAIASPAEVNATP